MRRYENDLICLFPNRYVVCTVKSWFVTYCIRPLSIYPVMMKAYNENRLSATIPVDLEKRRVLRTYFISGGRRCTLRSYGDDVQQQHCRPVLKQNNAIALRRRIVWRTHVRTRQRRVVRKAIANFNSFYHRRGTPKFTLLFSPRLSLRISHRNRRVRRTNSTSNTHNAYSYILLLLKNGR